MMLPTTGQPPVAARTLRLTAVVLIVALNAADALSTLELGGRELNPISAWLIDHGWLLAAKLALPAAMAVLALLAPAQRWIDQALWAVVAVYAVVVSSNVAQLAVS